MINRDTGADATDQETIAASEREWRQQRIEKERQGIAESKRIFDEADAFAAKQREDAKKKSAADHSFLEAAEFARNAIKSDGLDGEIRSHCEIRYTVAQGLKAAIHGREDGIATLVLQRSILVRLDSIKSLLWVVIALLFFVAYKIT
jgi:hypothetical protein